MLGENNYGDIARNYSMQEEEKLKATVRPYRQSVTTNCEGRTIPSENQIRRFDAVQPPKINRKRDHPYHLSVYVHSFVICQYVSLPH